jgi:HD-GYP domain-containing protein (c-di-GMP phosphodiesterase class II)
LTVSVGVSTLSNQTETYNVLIDTQIRTVQTKFMRRNKVEVYSSVFDQFAGMGGDKQIEENLRSLKTLITVINSRDTYTYKHVERVVNYCGIMADFLGLSIEDRRNLIYSAYLHDLGKINISKEVLVSDQKLTPEEWEELKRHPQDSADIIKQIDGLSELAPIVLQHHEKYDGSGYPSGIAGEEILYLARLLTVIDSFDAMTNQRPYQKIKTFDEAFEEIRQCKGTQFDPELAEQFIEAIKSL